MDNEEPIEMAHYPAGHAPEPGIVPAIEREDFPAPPYPYAVEGFIFAHYLWRLKRNEWGNCFALEVYCGFCLRGFRNFECLIGFVLDVLKGIYNGICCAHSPNALLLLGLLIFHNFLGVSGRQTFYVCLE